MLAPLIAAAFLGTQVQPSTFGLWGEQTLEKIRSNYYLPSSKLYADTFQEGAQKQPAFNWGVGVMLSALTSAARWDQKYRPWLKEYVEASRVYWNPKGPVAGYDVLPGPKPVDRYYDDNEWMALQLVEAYEILEEPRYLTWARETLRYVLSGEDEKLGGGIYWKEAEKYGKNTCSNAPAVATILAIYGHQKDARLLSKAISLYNWTKRNLQDPADKLFWDAISLDGRVDRTKWSYNTALMIRSAGDLYKYTRNPAYKADQQAMASAAKRKWMVSGAIRDEGRFAHLLLEALIVTDSISSAEVSTALAKLNETKNREEFFGKRFYEPAPASQKEFELIDQASAARAFFYSAVRLWGRKEV